MNSTLESVFAGIDRPSRDLANHPVYSVVPAPKHEGHFVGKDGESHACVLVATSPATGRRHPAIRLENLDVQFDLRCRLRREGQPEKEGIFTVIRCRSRDSELIRHFFSTCDALLSVLGSTPSSDQVATSVERLVSIFQKLQDPASRSLNGLFGELFLISKSANPVRSLTAWRVDDTARFDFSTGPVRLEVKTTAGRVRAHTFSYDQCNPPEATNAVVASLFVEKSPDGLSFRVLMDQVESAVADQPDLAFKLHQVVATTLGSSLRNALSVMFDAELAESSLRFFDLTEVPAIRGDLPERVSDVHFRSDLSDTPELTAAVLADGDPVFAELLPPSPGPN